MSETSSSPTAPQGVQFRPVSAKLITVRVLATALWLLVPAVAFAVWAIITGIVYLWIGVAVCALLFVWLLWLIPRQVKAIGFATEESDFLVRKGVLFQSLVVVPYGRIQYVDVKEGPVARRLGIASIQLHTASAQTDASLDGLRSDEAAQLRDLLVANGSSELSGL